MGCYILYVGCYGLYGAVIDDVWTVAVAMWGRLDCYGLYVGCCVLYADCYRIHVGFYGLYVGCHMRRWDVKVAV